MCHWFHLNVPQAHLIDSSDRSVGAIEQRRSAIAITFCVHSSLCTVFVQPAAGVSSGCLPSAQLSGWMPATSSTAACAREAAAPLLVASRTDASPWSGAPPKRTTRPATSATDTRSPPSSRLMSLTSLRSRRIASRILACIVSSIRTNSVSRTRNSLYQFKNQSTPMKMGDVSRSQCKMESLKQVQVMMQASVQTRSANRAASHGRNRIFIGCKEPNGIVLVTRSTVRCDGPVVTMTEVAH